MSALWAWHLAMQGSGISAVDTGSVEIRLCDEGTYVMAIGATDMGTGCDTILAQMAAESLDCPIENIAVHGVDTDHSPYDCGSYASSTTYVTGMAVVKTCEKLIRQLEAAAQGCLRAMRRRLFLKATVCAVRRTSAR